MAAGGHWEERCKEKWWPELLPPEDGPHENQTEDELDDYWQVIEPPEGHFAFNHVTLQVIPPGDPLPAPAIALPNA